MLVLASSGEAITDKRIALVIGNGAYQADMSPLKNPPNDADLIAATLESAGYKVILKKNSTYREMRGAIRDFGASLDTNTEALFFYAGHGVQYNGANYLVPIDARVTYAEDIGVETINLEMVLAKMQGSRSKVNILVLDACRNNPFAERFSFAQGLAYVNAPTGTFIAYATAPGSVAFDGEGSNSIYSEALAENINKEQLGIEDVFKLTRTAVREKTRNVQVPWESSSLEGEYFFHGGFRKDVVEKRKMAMLEDAMTSGNKLNRQGVYLSDEGDDATTMYRKVLLLDPVNAEALSKLDHIAKFYTHKVQQSLAEKDLEGALANLGYAMQVDASNLEVIRARELVISQIESLEEGYELDQVESGLASVIAQSEKKMADELRTRDVLQRQLHTELSSVQKTVELQREQIDDLVRTINEQNKAIQSSTERVSSPASEQKENKKSRVIPTF